MIVFIEELIGLIFSILFFFFVAFAAFHIWFRDGADKLSKGTKKFYKENAPRSVSKFDEIATHPLVWKVGSIIMLLGGLFCIFVAINALW